VYAGELMPTVVRSEAMGISSFVAGLGLLMFPYVNALVSQNLYFFKFSKVFSKALVPWKKVARNFDTSTYLHTCFCINVEIQIVGFKMRALP
jgi:hypothetical protein